VIMEKRFYELPELPYGYDALAPHISEEQLRIHHDKHHAGYVQGANAILEKMDKARADGTELDMKSTLKALSFNVGGHMLHSLFWANMSPDGGGEPAGPLAGMIDGEFGCFDWFRKEFAQAATSVEGSGWGALAYDSLTDRLMLLHIEKHHVHLHPNQTILLVLDVWEHAYYLDYRNDRAGFVNAFWSIVDWDEVGKRLEGALSP